MSRLPDPRRDEALARPSQEVPALGLDLGARVSAGMHSLSKHRLDPVPVLYQDLGIRGLEPAIEQHLNLCHVLLDTRY